MSGLHASAGQLRTVLEMIKFSHTIFALPFALGALLLASGGRPQVFDAIWIVVAMVGARSAAMAFNRLVDRRFDAENPRTRERALASGQLGVPFVVGFITVSAGAYFLAAGMLNTLCLMLSPLVLAVLLGYSYAKRFTELSHLWLGVALGLSPVASWLAVRGSWDASLRTPALLGLAVVFWVCGFDLIYACQDADYDRQARLRSIPARFGVRPALRVARVLHGFALAALIAVGPLTGFGWIWALTLAVVGALLVAEHVVADPDRPGSLHQAFFQLNSWVGPVVLFGIAAEVWT